jgi:hypothetical protein
MIVKETFLICNGCNKNFGIDMRSRNGLQQREAARLDGWRLVVGDGFKYGDYCADCLADNRHKKTKK